MASTILIKRSQTNLAPTTLSYGEIAYSFGTLQTMYVGDSDGRITTIGGEAYVDLVNAHDALLDHTPGTLTASSAIIVDAQGTIDQLIVDNVEIDGNTILTSAGNLTLAPASDIDVSNSKILNLATPTLVTDAATKGYVDGLAGTGSLSLLADATSGDVSLADSALDIIGGTGLDTVVVNNAFTISLENTAVTAASYGNAGTLTIPTFTVDAQGRLTAAGEYAVPDAILTITDGVNTDQINLLDSDLTFTGGTGITATVSNNTLTIAGDDATTTTKGIASFAATDFSVTSGAVSIATGGVSNTQLTNSDVTIGSTTIALGTSSTTLAGLTSVTSTSVVAGDMTLSGSSISSTGTDITVDDNLVVTGDLTVQGTTTTVNSTVVEIADLNITVASGSTNAAAANGAGLTADLGTDGSATLTYSSANDEWELNKALNVVVTPGSEPDAFQINGDSLISLIYADMSSTIGGTALTASISGLGEIIIDADIATTTTLGVASYNSSDFAVSVGGEVTLNVVDGGTF